MKFIACVQCFYIFDVCMNNKQLVKKKYENRIIAHTRKTREIKTKKKQLKTKQIILNVLPTISVLNV